MVDTPVKIDKDADQNCSADFLTVIERLSARPDIPVEKIKQIMDMQEHILDRNAKQAFNAAMVRAQANMPVVPKDLKNTQTSSWYSGYETILKYCKPIYTKEGFAIVFSQGFATPENPLADGYNRIVADVMHEDGHTKIVFADIPAETTGPKGGTVMTKTHATGSSFSYGRSYLVRLVFNIPTGDDDDGNGTTPEDTITTEQVEIIKGHLKTLDRTEAKFCEYLKVESLDTLPAKRFNEVMTVLKESLKVHAKKAKEEKKADPVKKADDDLKKMIANKNKELEGIREPGSEG